jgi:hypothetical protein
MTLEKSDSLPSIWDPATHVVLLTDGKGTGSTTATTCTQYVADTWSAHSPFVMKQLADFVRLIQNTPNGDRELFFSIKLSRTPI